MGSQKWRSLERSTRKIFLLQHVLEEISRVGRGRSIPRNVAGFIDELNEQGRISWDELFIDGSFAPAKKGAKTLEKPSVERVQSGWWWLMAREYLGHAPRIRPKGLRSNSHQKT
jgi:hypothetical protein